MSLKIPKVMQDLRGILALGFVPGMCEAIVVMIMSRYMLDVSWTWGLMAGFMHAAVSPAVVVPAAIALQEKSLGTKTGLPTRLLSATCIEVVVAIVGFSVCFRMAVNPLDPTYADNRPPWLQAALPAFEVIAGLAGGCLIGYALSFAMPGGMGQGAARAGSSSCVDNIRRGCGSTRAASSGERSKAYAFAFYNLLGGGTFAVSYCKYVGFAGGGSLVCVMVAIVCGGAWEVDVDGKGEVIKRLNETWLFVQVTSWPFTLHSNPVL